MILLWITFYTKYFVLSYSIYIDFIISYYMTLIAYKNITEIFFVLIFIIIFQSSYTFAHVVTAKLW